MKPHRHGLTAAWLSLITFFCLFSCATPQQVEKPLTTMIPFQHTMGEPIVDSPLLKVAHEAERTATQRVAILNIGAEALLARIHLIRAATSSISIQTLIWRNDEAGRYVMYELIAAANRGVSVRLIIDHIASERDPDIAAYLASVHPNLKIKIYNPVATLGFKKKIDPSLIERAGGVLTRFSRINQRMHNKVFIVDNCIAITGGRNFENSYFDQASALNYKDRDALISGPVVKEMTTSFEHFWAYNLSVDLDQLADVSAIRKLGKVKKWNTRGDFALHGYFDKMEHQAADPHFIQATFADRMHGVTQATIIADDPGKNNKKGLGLFQGAGKITKELARLISRAKKSVLIQTPYLVLSDQAVDLFKTLRKRHPDIDIRISTNSLAATDSWYTYAISYQQKQTYIKNLKFKIYEFKPYPRDVKLLMPTWDALRIRPPSKPDKLEYPLPVASNGDVYDETTWNFPTDEAATTNTQTRNEPYLCMHAKSMVIDDEIAFIGSYNLDPRSENLNTEVGLIVTDAAVAQLLKKNILIDTRPENAWVIARNDYPAIIEETNAILELFSGLVPIVDPWPVRYAGSYELKKGKSPLDPDHPDFYHHYRYMGSFPQVGFDRLDKIMGSWILKTFGGITRPLL